MAEENFENSSLKMLHNNPDFFTISFTWLKKILEVHLWRCTSMIFILTNFGIITFTMVEEIFEDSSLKMVQNYPNFFVSSLVEENFENPLWMTFNLTNFVMITFNMVEEIMKKKYSKMVQNGS